MARKSREEMRKRRHRRLRARLSGTSERPRLNVYRSSENTYAQVIDDSVGHTLAAASTIEPEIVKLISDKTKTEAARIVGEKIAQRASEAGIKQVVFDRGGYQYHGRIKALADGARDGGLDF